jgi:mannose-6-phosphate isomerase-like protein (cupin superfamily)
VARRPPLPQTNFAVFLLGPSYRAPSSFENGGQILDYCVTARTTGGELRIAKLDDGKAEIPFSKHVLGKYIISDTPMSQEQSRGRSPPRTRATTVSSTPLFVRRGKKMNAPVNLSEKLATFTDRFSPRTIATYNANDIMVAKLEGAFHWHKHDETDDFFLVLKGTLDIELPDRTVTLNSGEVFVVPKGIEHRPVARGEVHILLIEPTGTPNTGDKATAAPRILA